MNKTNLQIKYRIQEKKLEMDYNLQINEFPDDEKTFVFSPKEQKVTGGLFSKQLKRSCKRCCDKVNTFIDEGSNDLNIEKQMNKKRMTYEEQDFHDAGIFEEKSGKETKTATPLISFLCSSQNKDFKKICLVTNKKQEILISLRVQPW